MTNREEVVERVAHEICQKSPAMFDGEGHGCGASCRAMRLYENAARAALSIAEEAVLEEMMGPAPEMDEAGHQAMGWGNAQVWQAMLSASGLYRRVKGA